MKTRYLAVCMFLYTFQFLFAFQSCNLFGKNCPIAFHRSKPLTKPPLPDQEKIQQTFSLFSSRRDFFSSLLIPIAAIGCCKSQCLAKDSAVVSSELPLLGSALNHMDVSSWEKNRKIVHIVGTAHISNSSAVLTGEVVKEVKPDALFLELDRKRFSKAFADEEIPPGLTVVYKNLDGDMKIGKTAVEGNRNILTVIKKRMRELVADPIDAFMPTTFKRNDNTKPPGQEFVRAVEEGQKVNSTIVLGDEDVDRTLIRLIKALDGVNTNDLIKVEEEMANVAKRVVKTKLPQTSGTRFILSESELEDLVESLKTKSTVSTLMKIIEENLPQFHYALITERDRYMSHYLDDLGFRVTVAIVGMAHVEGVENNLLSLGWRRIK